MDTEGPEGPGPKEAVSRGLLGTPPFLQTSEGAEDGSRGGEVMLMGVKGAGGQMPLLYTVGHSENYLQSFLNAIKMFTVIC